MGRKIKMELLKKFSLKELRLQVGNLSSSLENYLNDTAPGFLSGYSISFTIWLLRFGEVSAA